MSYGFQVFGSNDNILIDSNAYSMIQTSESVQSWTNQTNITVGSDEIIGIRYDANGAGTNGQSTVLLTDTGPLVWTNNSGVTLEYIQLKLVVDNTSQPTAQNYGIETFDDSGNLSFSSRYVKAFKIEEFFAAGDATGGVNNGVGANGDVLYSGTDQDVFVTLQNPHFDAIINAFDSGSAHNNYTFYSDGKIRYLAYFSFPAASQTIYWTNWSSIFSFTLRN